MGVWQEKVMDNTEWRNNNWGKFGDCSFSFLCKTKPALSSEHCVGEFKAALGLSRKGCTEVCHMLHSDCQYRCYKFAISGAEHPSQMCNQISESTGCLIGRSGSKPVPLNRAAKVQLSVFLVFSGRGFSNLCWN